MFGQCIRCSRLGGGLLNMPRDLTDRSRHFSHGGCGRVRFGPLLEQGMFSLVREQGGMCSGFSHLVSQIAQSSQGGFKTRIFADQYHFQLC
ncbi:hypothetical protein D3C71_1601590 [compost metagenome]